MTTKLLGSIAQLFLLAVVPFIILIRGAVYLHTSSNYLPSVCIIGGAIMTIILLFTYLSFIHQLFIKGGKAISVKSRLVISLVVVLLYVVHGLFYISGSNMKSSSLRSEVRKVHPVMRLAVSTLIHLDKDLIITDAERQPEDYKKMGLKSKKHSLHYKQDTGYSHALDLRTRGRPIWKNFLVRNYFRLMGFRTLRHIGTADHLHISLMSHEHPYAK